MTSGGHGHKQSSDWNPALPAPGPGTSPCRTWDEWPSPTTKGTAPPADYLFNDVFDVDLILKPQNIEEKKAATLFLICLEPASLTNTALVSIVCVFISHFYVLLVIG